MITRTTTGRLLAGVIALLAAVLLVSCGDSAPSLRGGNLEGEPLRIVAATELQDLEPAIEEAAEDLGFPIELRFPAGTLDNSQTLLDGGFDNRHDATWFATNRYVEILGAAPKLADATRIGTSPVAFGVTAAKAEELGWDERQPTWKEIAEAAADREVTFGMTDPSASNSGFSALVSVATALADTGQALTLADIDRITPQLKGFFTGQTMTSGSSGWLTDAFLADRSRADALINYESVLHSAVEEQGADLHVIVPADGVVSADYPLSTLARPAHPEAREKVAQLSAWLLEHPEVMTDSFRRPVDVSAQLPPELSSQLLIELPFPATRAITDQLVAAFHNDLRPPGDTAFVLDTSGSMAGERISLLKQSLHQLIDSPLEEGGLRDREQVAILPFADAPGAPISVSFSTSDPAPRTQLNYSVEGLRATGATAVYSALIDAYREVDGAGAGSLPSIVLMSDGEVTTGSTLEDFRAFHDSLPSNQASIPVFVILYGEANVGEMMEVAELTGGKVFDAIDGDLEAAFKEIRGYQ